MQRSFFTEELSESEGVYGSSMVINPPNFGWGFWMDVAAGNGVNYFDENMNPTINTSNAVEALDLFKEIVQFGPPGKESLGLSTSIQRWQSGGDVMSIWWIDLAEFTVQQQGMERAEDQRGDIVPGWPQEDGSINHRAISLWCRTGAIPKNAPEDVKEAAFYFLYRMSHPDYSDDIVADEYCGSDPFGLSHYTDAAAQKYLGAQSAAWEHRPLGHELGYLPELRYGAEPSRCGPEERRGRLSSVLLGGCVRVRRCAWPEYPEGNRRPAHQPAGARRGGRGMGPDRAEAGHR